MTEGSQGQPGTKPKPLTALGALVALAVVVFVVGVGYEYVVLLGAAVTWAAELLGARGKWARAGSIVAYVVLLPGLPLAAMWAWAAYYLPWRDRRIRAGLEERIARADPAAALATAERLAEAVANTSPGHARALVTLLERALGPGRCAAEMNLVRERFARWLGAVAYGDGAFNADGWAAVTREEDREAVGAAVAGLVSALRAESVAPPG